MRPDQWDLVQEILGRAKDVPDESRQAFLQKECGGDAEVLKEVESLLGYASGEELSRGRLLSDLQEAVSEEHPQTIAHYRVLRVLGAGGMGVVYEAEQERPVRRTVAIKLIKMGMDTQRVVSRFSAERQALAIMNHPSIARVYEAGATEEGRHYFVMEYVDGVPITKYCDDACLGIRERLDLFMRVCDGVQHAHQKGIIHRDLKPSNVLVEVGDDGPAPKIIDFGIAKATDKRAIDATMQTELGQIVGTIDYMSPEQARMTGRDIDTRTDVYSLGVLLYELLVAEPPFDATGDGTAFDEMLRQIRETDPPVPSARLKNLGDVSGEVSRKRRTAPDAFIRVLRGDLDWIVMKALEKDPDRRYSSAADFAADVRRYLRSEPVVARPPSVAYRSGKFVRRHRTGVAFAAILVLALLGGIVGTTVGLLQARRAEREARDAQRVATAEAASFEKMADYLVEMFKLADPVRSEGVAVTAQELLDARAETIGEDLAEEPRARGRIMTAMGRAYRGLGLHMEAMPLLEEALPVLREAYGADHPAVYDALNELGNLANELSDYEKAVEYYEEALDIAERLHGPVHEAIPYILKNLSDAHIELGNLDTAKPLLLRALEIRRVQPEGVTLSSAQGLSKLGEILWKSGDAEGALEMAEESLRIRQEVRPPQDPSIGYGHFHLGDAQLAAGRHADAEASYEAAKGNWAAAYGPDDWKIGECDLQIATAQARQGSIEAAYDTYKRARSIVEQAFGADRVETARGLVDYLDRFGDLLDELERPAEAEETRREAASLRARYGLESRSN